MCDMTRNVLDFGGVVLGWIGMGWLLGEGLRWLLGVEKNRSALMSAALIFGWVGQREKGKMNMILTELGPLYS